jgi:hypothetical protein
MRLYSAIGRLVLFAISIIENRTISMGDYQLRQFTILCRHGDGDGGGGDAEARRDITSARGDPAPCTLAPTLARLERSRAAKPLWSQTQTEQPSTPAHAAAMRIIELVIDVCCLMYVCDAH